MPLADFHEDAGQVHRIQTLRALHLLKKATSEAR